MDPVAVASLDAWTPIRVRGDPAAAVIDWAVIDGPYSDAFFEQTVDRVMQHPFNQLFARTTGFDVLNAVAEGVSPVEPAGFVFHMSRCGSTLIAQMLSRLSDAVVLSEPQPIDAVLQRRRDRYFDDAAATRYLRVMLAMLARGRGDVRRVFVKFHAWHVFDLPFVARTFPKTPWIFAYREPRAVLRSQHKIPGIEIAPGATDPRLAGIEPAALARVSPDEYGARMLAAFCSAALECAGLGRGRFVDYASLPDAVLSEVLPLFGVSPMADEAERMRDVATVDAKGGREPFRAAVVPQFSPEIERLAVAWLDPVYAALRAVR